jgi:hypothetical protein
MRKGNGRMGEFDLKVSNLVDSYDREFKRMATSNQEDKRFIFPNFTSPVNSDTKYQTIFCPYKMPVMERHSMAIHKTIDVVSDGKDPDHPVNRHLERVMGRRVKKPMDELRL